MASYPFQFEKAFLTEPIHVSNKTIISAYKRLGKGRVGTTTLQNTYQLVLDGQARAYKQLWADIINAISNRKVPEWEWESRTMFATKDQPYEFKISSANLVPTVVNSEGSPHSFNAKPRFFEPMDRYHLS